MAYDVFISYRRDGGAEFAIQVKDALKQAGFNPFLDIESMRSGPFNVQLLKRIDECSHFLLILPPGALDRCSSKDDWLRQEVEYAIKQRKHIVPVLMKGFSFPEWIPPSMAAIKLMQAVIPSPKLFEDTLQDIVDYLRDPEWSTSEYDLIDTSAFKSSPVTEFRYRNKRKLIIGGIAALILVVAIAIGFAVTNNSQQSYTYSGGAKNAAATVYRWDVLPYTKAGTVTSVASLSEKRSTGLEVDKAFSVLSFIGNNDEKAARVEMVSFEIESLEPMRDPVFAAGAALENNHLKVYLINDSHVKVSNATVSLTGRWGNWPDAESEDVSSFVTDKTSVTINNMDQGGVLEVFNLSPNVEQFVELVSKQDISGLSLFVNIKAGETESSLYIGELSYSENSGTLLFQIAGGRGGGDSYRVTLFSVLDVDSNPTRIVFTGEDATPRVEDTFAIETVIAPTKSCAITGKGLYSVNGVEQATDVFTVLVTVPYYTNVGELSPIYESLAASGESDPAKLRDMLSSLVYDPESIVSNEKG